MQLEVTYCAILKFEFDFVFVTLDHISCCGRYRIERDMSLIMPLSFTVKQRVKHER
jgi:hypothetical protein